METEELKNLWQAYDSKLEKVLSINIKYIEIIQAQKARSAFQHLMARKLVSLVWGSLCAFIFASFTYHNYAQPHLLVSGGVMMLLCIIHVGTCIGHIKLISEMKLTGGVTEMQEKLATFQSLSARYSRLAVLMFPLWIACLIVFFKLVFNMDLVAIQGKDFWLPNLMISLLFLPPSIWFYKKMSVKNMHIPWVRKLIESGGGKSAVKAIEFLKEIEDFKNI